VLVGEMGEVKVKDKAGGKQKKLRVYDRFLKEFRYGAALDSALKRVRRTSLLRPSVTRANFR
jgi:hypothetical protein